MINFLIMRILKYIIYQGEFVVFIEEFSKHIKVLNYPVSAGYAIIYYDLSNNNFKVKCYGGCDFLRIYCRDFDNSILESMFNRHLKN